MIPQPAAKCLNTAMQKLNTAIVTLGDTVVQDWF